MSTVGERATAKRVLCPADRRRLKKSTGRMMKHPTGLLGERDHEGSKNPAACTCWGKTGSTGSSGKEEESGCTTAKDRESAEQMLDRLRGKKATIAVADARARRRADRQKGHERKVLVNALLSKQVDGRREGLPKMRDVASEWRSKGGGESPVY